MKILLSSYHFSPSIGGIETVSALLASEFVRRGHVVKVITETEEDDSREWPFSVYRGPSLLDVLSLARWCDVFFHNNISLHSAWPLLIFRRPWVIAHQTWISRLDRSLAWQDRLKRFILKFGTHISISRSIADDLRVPSVVIGNPYREEIFYRMENVARENELIYLGRLVSDKGVDLLIRALALLKNEALTPRLTIAGSGPEDERLRVLAAELQVREQIQFVGPQTGEALAHLLNQHRVMVVPSRWAEPFGLVALEGIACGCVVVGSRDGGLPEAIGPCGVTFPNGDVNALADALRKALTDSNLREQWRQAGSTHLSTFTAGVVAERYLQAFQEALS